MASTIGNSILFVFVALLLAFCGYEVKKKLKIPASPILLIFGIFIRTVSNSTGTAGVAFQQVDHIDPEMILYAMMPALIFEAGISTDWHTFRKVISQILIMATTVVFLSALLTASTIVYILGYGFSWNEAFLLGVILSATDHVAVVAQLKELYIDDAFETLIQGETLLNEASVFVLFSVMLGSLTGSQDFSQSITLFLRLSLGGLSLGLAFSLVFSMVIKRMINDELQQTNLTIVTTYLLFFTADGTSVHVSGALAVVAFGLFMSAYGKTLISPSVEKNLHEFWSLISTCMESIIFIMAGMLLGMQLVDSSNYLQTSDMWNMIALFMLLHFTRGISIMIHYPLLQSLGYGLEPKEAVVLTLSGLKGAIATALALIAYIEPDLDPRFRSILLFFTTGICALTIVIDSILMKSAVRYFGMETLTEVQENMLIGVTTGILQHTSKKVQKLRNDKELNLIRWDFVMKFAGPKRLLVQIMKGSRVGSKILNRYKDESAEQLLERYTRKFNLTSSSLVDETRRRYFTTLKGIYWHFFESGKCMGITALNLISSCNKALDTEKNYMSDWEMLRPEMALDGVFKCLNAALTLPLIGNFFKVIINKKLLRSYDAATTFISAHEEAECIMDQMEIDIDEGIFKDVMEEAHIQVKQCKKFLYSNILDCYPYIPVQLQTRKACKCLLISQRKLVNKIFEQGVIQELECKFLMTAINESVKGMKKIIKTGMPTIREMLSNRFADADPAEIEAILPEIKEVVFEAGSVIYRENEPCVGGYLILNGRVRERSSWIKQELVAGNILGAQHLLPEFSKNTSTATASIQVIAAHLPRHLINIPSLIKDLYKEASEELLILNKECFGLNEVKQEHIFRAVSHSKIVQVKKGMMMDTTLGAMVLSGEVGRKAGYAFLRPRAKQVVAVTDIVCLVLPEQLSVLIQQFDTLAQAFAAYYFRDPVKRINLEADQTENADLIELKSLHKLQRIMGEKK